MGIDFESSITSLDTSLFAAISSQTSRHDKRSLLAVQKAVRAIHDGYTYLEIGSFRGGSIQPHLLDDCCQKIYSIDKRPPGAVPDVRGPIGYADNTTRAMLNRLRELAPNQVDKITCFDDDARDIPTSYIDMRPHLCFIDGEHTNRTAFSDFQFCLSVCRPDSIIVFHDSDLVHKGIAAALIDLRRRSVQFAALRLPDVIFLIALGDAAGAVERNLERKSECGMSYVVNMLAK